MLNLKKRFNFERDKMKKIIFVLLKLVEIPIIIFVPYWTFGLVDERTDVNWFLQWISGFLVLVCIVGGAALGAMGCYGLYKGNLLLAEWIKNNFF